VAQHPPEIAVIIPTRQRETRLAFALDALAEQTLASDRFEVIVVRDSDAHPPLACAPAGLRARFMTNSGVSGPTAKRNLGWRATSAKLVAFTDDDCRPSPDWLDRLLREAGGPDVFLQGRTEPDPDERHRQTLFDRSREITAPSDWYPACNIAYPRALLESLDGFDEAFWFGGEDTDLGLRARADGARLAYVPDALVWHAVLVRSLPDALRDASRWPSLPLVVARHPSQRRAVYGRFFWKRSHASLLVAAAGTLMWRRSRLVAASAALPYLKQSLDLTQLTPRRTLRQLIHLPARALVDAVEIVATARAAIRHRVFLV